MPNAATRDEVKAAKFKYGHLHAIDKLPWGDPRIGAALYTFAHHTDINKQSRHWKRTINWMENILFGLGRHYIDDILASRLSRDASTGDLSVTREITRNIPRPVNDLLGRYIETNIALYTENKPRPRVTAKSDKRDDRIAAELSELTVEYLWEALKLPSKMREISRLMLYCGIAWLEIGYDPLEPRFIAAPQTEEQNISVTPGEGYAPVETPLTRTVPKLTADGELQFDSKPTYGEMKARVVSGFEMHLPVAHAWNDDEMGWIMREWYTPIDVLKDKYFNPDVKNLVTKEKGWFLENLAEVAGYNVQNLPLWWWERLADIVEGPGPSIYTGTPEQWADYTVVRIFDRKPNSDWPKGRTIIVAGDKVIYDSPKEVGARAYDPRWPHRWHPYIRMRWEGQVGTIYGRSLVSKLLPKLKRVNAIDTTFIMWRRTVPIATWLVPKGSAPVEDIFSGRPGQFWEYDPRRTMQQAPQPVYPPSYPSAALEERQQQIAEMESIAGTEEILRGQRPTGVNSAMMLDALRRQAMASKSASLQEWDEGLEEIGGAMIQDVKKHVRNDPAYAERLKILSREKVSRVTIGNVFSGTELSDNVVVRVDTASMALVSREARQQRALEVIQYAPNLMALPPTLRKKLIDELGWPDTLVQQSADINRVQMLISFIKQGQYDRIMPFPEDDPFVFHEFLVEEIKGEEFWELPEEQQRLLLQLTKKYEKMIEAVQVAQMKMNAEMQSEEAVNEATAKGGVGG